MLKSMTAYASMEKEVQDLNISVEIRTYNSRHLDIALKLPHGLAALEEKIKAAIGGLLVRGRIEVRIRVKDTSEKGTAFEVDAAKAKAYYAAAQALKIDLNLSDDLPLAYLAAIPGVIKPTENEDAATAYWPLMESCLTEALAVLDGMRRQEGEHIQSDFTQRLAWIEEQLGQIEQSVDGLLEQYRDKLQARIESLTQGAVELDPVRIAQEAAMLADRSDISEEIVRARSHIVQFRDTMHADEPAGRKLNFLLQEFNREFNTMGSKVGQARVAHMIVAVKAELEKLREQVQNVE